MGIFFKKRKTATGRRNIYFLGIKIFSYQKKESLWRQRNPHNFTEAGKILNMNHIFVGTGSYGEINVEDYAEGGSNLKIGNYCSIGPNVHFILNSEHPYTGLSTYPFKVKLGLQEYEAHSKGDIVLEDDVWIGLGAIINSGVHIGKGAIVASGSVVVKNVEPYSIVGGNPARHIKYRFDKPIREKLMTFDFSKINKQTFINNIDSVYQPLTLDNIDDILCKLTSNGENQ